MKLVMYAIVALALLVSVLIVVWSIGLPECSVDSLKGPTIGGVLRLAGC